jgi:predicted RNA binding protein YcfA (HicA-like mRNA interferase family)
MCWASRCRNTCRCGCVVKVRDLLKLLAKDGWLLKNQEGSHRQYTPSAKRGKVTVAGHMSEELDPKTKKSILKQAELS